MSTNPYQSPQAEITTSEEGLPLRDAVLKSLRVATLLLTAAWLFNYFCLCFHGRTSYIGQSIPFTVTVVAFTIGSLMIGLIALVCWFAVLPVLEFVNQTARRMIAPITAPEPWERAFYISLKPAAMLALPGMILWIIWVIGFYLVGVNFYVISYSIGIPAHILAACLYVPLLFRWYKLWRSTVPRADSEAT